MGMEENEMGDYRMRTQEGADDLAVATRLDLLTMLEPLTGLPSHSPGSGSVGHVSSHGRP